MSTPTDPASPSASDAPGQVSFPARENVLEGLSRIQVPVATKAEVTYEDPAEAAHKRSEDAAESAHQRQKEIRAENYKRWKEGALFAVTVGVLIVCVVILLRPSASPESQAWARSTAALIVGAFLGYITGQASKP